MSAQGAKSDFSFPKAKRLRSTAEFQVCYDGAKSGDDHLLIFGALNSLQHTRIGVSVSRKHGNAVVRARKKRLMREAFRLSQHKLISGLDLVLVPRQRADSDLADYQRSLTRLVRKVARKIREDR